MKFLMLRRAQRLKRKLKKTLKQSLSGALITSTKEDLGIVSSDSQRLVLAANTT